MEATTLSPDSALGLFNPGATNGNLQTAPGSVLPFSSILQSQQQPKIAVSSERLDSSMVSAETLDQLSLSGRNGTAAAPWLVLGLQDSSTEGFELSSQIEDEELLLSSMPELQAVPVQADQLAALSGLPHELEQMAAVSLEQSKSAQRTLELADLAQRTQINALREGAGEGNGSADALISDSTGASTGYLQAQEGLSATDSEQLQTLRYSPSQSGNNSILPEDSTVGQGAESGNSELDIAAVSESSLEAGSSEKINSAELNNARVLASSGLANNTNGNVSLQENRLAASASTEATALEADLLTAEGSAVNADGSLKSLESGVPLPAGSLTANSTLQKSDLAVAREANNAISKNSSSANQSTGEITLDSADIASTLTESVDVAGATVGLGAAAADPLNNQLRSAAPLQVKRSGGAERIDVSTAVDASDGYHWLNGAADSAAEPVAELAQTGALEDLDGSGLATASNTASTSNNARSEAAAVESFAAVKRSADVAVSSGNNATNSTEQSNSVSLEVDTPVQDAQWSQALAYRVQFMAQEGIQRAQVQLNPAELGPIEITVDLADDVAKVQITAENAATREAVELAVPRLREMMALSGFNETGVELSSGSEEPNSSGADAEQLQQSNAGASGDRGARDGGSRADGQATTPEIKTLGSNEVPQRSSDGRLSFYV